MDVVENLWALARSGNPVNVEIGRSMAASVGCPADEYEEAVNWKRCQCQTCSHYHWKPIETCIWCGLAGRCMGIGPSCGRCLAHMSRLADIRKEIKYVLLNRRQNTMWITGLSLWDAGRKSSTDKDEPSPVP